MNSKTKRNKLNSVKPHEQQKCFLQNELRLAKIFIQLFQLWMVLRDCVDFKSLKWILISASVEGIYNVKATICCLDQSGWLCQKLKQRLVELNLQKTWCWVELRLITSMIGSLYELNLTILPINVLFSFNFCFSLLIISFLWLILSQSIIYQNLLFYFIKGKIVFIR